MEENDSIVYVFSSSFCGSEERRIWKCGGELRGDLKTLTQRRREKQRKKGNNKKSEKAKRMREGKKKSERGARRREGKRELCR